MAVRLQVVFDAADPPKLAAFWGEAIGYVEEDPPDGFGSWESWAVANGLPREDWDNYASRVDPDGAGPRLFFQRVPEPKTAKNRVHLDLAVSGGRDTPIEDRRRRIADAAERAVAAGATRVRAYD
jgi:Glyoxalase-like domain